MKISFLRKCPLLIVTLFLGAWLSTVFGGNYYIDYINGTDTSEGSSPDTPWKHSPGDPNASAIAAGHVITPGDTFNFRGGVVYKGEISIPSYSGSTNWICFYGDSWGDSKAILDGSVDFTNLWLKCSNADECAGNPFWTNIWYAPTAFSTQTVFNTIIVSNQSLPFSQSYNPPTPIYFDLIENWLTVPNSSVSTNSLTDPRVFYQTDSNYWAEALIALHRVPNLVSFASITAFDPANHRVSFDLGNVSFYDPTPYCLINHPYLIDSPGEYCVRQGRIYLWPPGSGDPNRQWIRVAQCNRAFSGYSCNNILIKGFKIEAYYGGLYPNYSGQAIKIGGSTWSSNISVLNNEIRLIRSMTQGPVVGLQKLRNVTMAGNRIEECLRSRGTILSGANFTIASNSLYHVGGTGIYFAGVTAGVISSNHVSGILSAHANGVTVYQGSANVLVERNYLEDCCSAITFQDSTNLSFANNIVDGTHGGIYEWGPTSGGYIHFFNNTFVNNPLHFILQIGKSTNASYIVQNNIIDGTDFGFGDIAHNTYTGLSWRQAQRYGWTLRDGETIATNLASVFINPASRDYRLQRGSIAVEGGTNLSKYFITDISGLNRSSWDTGAFRFSADALPAPANLRVTSPQVTSSGY